MGRPARFEGAEDWAQHLVWATRNRTPLLGCERVADRCLAAFELERRHTGCEVFGYVLMPDHIHMVIGPACFPPGSIVQWMKLRSAHWLRLDGLVTPSPWARGYWDRAIRDNHDLARTLLYLHANPVKANLVDCLEEYRFSSFGDYYGMWRSILTITPAPLL